MHQQRGERDGNIGEHEQREEGQIHHLFQRGDGDAPPLGENGEQAVSEHHAIAPRQHIQQGTGDVAEHETGEERRQGEHRHTAEEIDEDGGDGQQRTGRDGHQHVVAGEADRPAQTAAQKRHPAVGVDLIKPFGPAHALPPRLGEGDGLLVVENRVVTIADAPALRRADGGELDVFGEQMIRPAAVFFDDFGGDQKARAGDGAVGMQLHAGIVEEARLAQEPDGIPGGNPARSEILGISIAGEHVIPLREGSIHRGDEMRIDDIIRVEDEERIVIGEGTAGANLTEQLVERVALADLIGVETLKRDGARLTRDAGGGVRAVVGQDVDIQQLGRVILRAEAGNEFADDAFLVAGADQRGIAAARLGGRLPCGFPSVAAAERKAVKRVENLIQIG